MDILVFNDGRMLCTENPLQGNAQDLSNLAMLVTNPQNGDTLKYDSASGTWVNGEAASGLPSVTSTDNGKVLSVVNGTWAAAQGGSGGGVMVVTVDGETGALNRTWQEIHDAMQTGIVAANLVNDDNQVTQTIFDSASGSAETGYFATIGTFSESPIQFRSDTANGYPVEYEDEG